MKRAFEGEDVNLLVNNLEELQNGIHSSHKRGLADNVRNACLKIKRIMNVFGISREEAESKRKRHDRTRKQYHNIHSDFKWGDSRYYDVCINSSKLGEDITADLLETYIKERINKM